MSNIIKIALCGPSDVDTEIQRAKDVINDFNQREFTKSSIFLKHLHWRDNASPDLSQRPQAILNRQIIEEADVIIAIFWNRMGSSTGWYESGTEEEIMHAVVQKKRVMVYFSTIEDINKNLDEKQLSKLANFKKKLRTQGICENFSSRDEFKKKLFDHLSQRVDDWNKKILDSNQKRQQTDKTTIRQVQKGGSSNIQAGSIGQLTVKASAKPNIVIPLPEGSVSAVELKTIKGWINTLAEGEIGRKRGGGYAKWTNFFKDNLNASKLNFIKSSQMSEAQSLYDQQINLQKAGYKATAPDIWRRNQYAAIKAMMRQLGKGDVTSQFCSRWRVSLIQ